MVPALGGRPAEDFRSLRWHKHRQDLRGQPVALAPLGCLKWLLLDAPLHKHLRCNTAVPLWAAVVLLQGCRFLHPVPLQGLPLAPLQVLRRV